MTQVTIEVLEAECPVPNLRVGSHTGKSGYIRIIS